jgi:two-component system chemotaxis response regulator CheB
MRGALDFVHKPDAGLGIETIIKELKVKVKTVAGIHPAIFQPSEVVSPPAPAKLGPQLLQKEDPLIVIGASTGGPRALQQVLSKLPVDLPAAVMVVQHMPPGFTRSLAERLNETSPLIVQEAADGDRLARGLVLVAPGDHHLRLKGARQVSLDNGPRRHHVRPAADVTMESAVEHHGPKVIGVVLTGMGEDGTEGAGKIKAAGGKVIVEHESTSVVYGMPASVVKAGFADRVAPLPQIAKTLVKWVNHGSHGL